MGYPEFFQTGMGRDFYQRDVPNLVKALTKIAVELEKSNKKEEKSNKKEFAVFVALSGGLVDECLLFATEVAANEEADKYCKKNGIPTVDDDDENVQAWHNDTYDVYVYPFDEVIQ